MDPLDLKIGKLGNICEFEIVSLSNADPDGSVIVDNSRVQLDGQGGKVPLDMFSIGTEFLFAMVEDKECGINQCFPSDDPVTMGLDSLRWGCGAME
jgi:hypothetical protein